LHEVPLSFGTGQYPLARVDIALEPSRLMTADQFHATLQALQVAVFAGLGVVAFFQWRRRRGEAAAWLAVTFGSLALVVVVGEVVPEDATGTPVEVVEKITIVLLVLFPYFLYRFAVSFFMPIRWFYYLATGLTAATAAGALVVDIPESGTSGSVGFTILLYLVLAQWVLLPARVSVRLWRAGRTQAKVTRRRMQTLSIGSLGIAAALVLAVVSSLAEEPGATEILVQLLALASGPFFLLGFAPPSIVRSSWRIREQAELRDAEIRLLSADEPSDIAAIVLPHATHLVGGRGSLLVDGEGNLLGVHLLDEDEALATARGDLPAEDALDSVDSVDIPIQSGRLVVKASRYTPFFGEEEVDILRALAAVADLALTRARSLELERTTADELRKANQAMREFVAIASHDLRTPVTVIKGFCIALQEQWTIVSERDKLEYLSMMDRQADHLSRLVDDLLTVSRIDAHVVEIRKEPMEIAPAVARALEGLDAEVAVDVPSGLEAHADPHHVHRMLRNYVENALNYGGPPVKIEAKPRDGWIEVMVRDHGEGIDTQFKARLFERFARAQTGVAEGKQGTGLGLSIVRGLAQANGGEAWYEPNVPKGSCFGIRLPRIQS
jgi:signal transduction histidine kinase